MQLSDDAQPMGVRSETAWRWDRDGNIPGRRRGPRTIRIPAGQAAPAELVPPRGALSARGSSAEPHRPLDRQAERLRAAGAARGSPVAQLVKAGGSGRHDARPPGRARLAEHRLGVVVVEPQERLTHCGVRSLDPRRTTPGRAIAVVNQAENGTEDR